jgi:hypothetical protein
MHVTDWPVRNSELNHAIVSGQSELFGFTPLISWTCSMKAAGGRTAGQEQLAVNGSIEVKKSGRSCGQQTCDWKAFKASEGEGSPCGSHAEAYKNLTRHSNNKLSASRPQDAGGLQTIRCSR